MDRAALAILTDLGYENIRVEQGRHYKVRAWHPVTQRTHLFVVSRSSSDWRTLANLRADARRAIRSNQQ